VLSPEKSRLGFGIGTARDTTAQARISVSKALACDTMKLVSPDDLVFILSYSHIPRIRHRRPGLVQLIRLLTLNRFPDSWIITEYRIS
jgi:hypothetical protein